MAKVKADSTYSLGQTSICSDKPTKAKLQAAARAAGIPLTEYLRILADKAVEDIQGGFGITSRPEPDTISRIESLSRQAIEMSRIIPMSKSRRMSVLSLANRHIKFNELRHAEILFDKMSGEYEEYRAKENVKEAGQQELILQES